MTQETAKERIYREALDEINNLAIDVAMDFEETGIGSVDCGKIMDIVNKAFFEEANQQPSSTDKFSVEKPQEQLNTAKKYIEHVIGTIKHDGHLGTIQTDWILPDLKKALAAIGGDDD
ncbi:hypothetical protein QUE06_02890 [Lactococcus lactis]|uniref:hypothetical protein n=1 Tax=Lactococcus lactis TaxID=1358 RepID=UPI0025A08B4F|nr:hypothetical protein [Lactococcus lactis]MDM7533908.1 hypothetical protein [Lactococcus lactis]